MFTSADVLAVAPEFSAVTTDQWTYWIAQTELQLNRAVLGTRADMMGVMLCAHLMTKFGATGYGTGVGSNGLAQAESVGQVREQYPQIKAQTITEAWLSSTGYGTNYLRLLKLMSLTPLVPGGETWGTPGSFGGLGGFGFGCW